jgi:dipeptidyl-peptidase-4
MANASLSFPRRHAVTRRFTLGAPRDLRVAARAERVLFLRSSGPEDPVNGLWVWDRASATERLVVDPRTFGADDANLPAEERARRERARESGGGIVAFDADPELRVACFAVGGRIGRVDVLTGRAELLDSAPGGFDPRLAPDGETLAYVAGGGLRLIDEQGDRLLIGPDAGGAGTGPDGGASTVTWGLAEFVAAEEMGRGRGFWWAPDGQRLLVARVDVAEVATWWISAPVTPAEPPQPVRYPAAGSANAAVGLTIVARDGSRVEVAWDGDGWEYLAGVTWSSEGLRLTVQSRDQRTVAVLEVDPDTGSCTERYRMSDEAWVELVPGSPLVFAGRLVTVEDRGEARSLCVDGVAVTGAQWQVRRVIDVDAERILVTASADPTTVDVVAVGWDGAVVRRTDGDGVFSAVAAGRFEAVVGRSIADDAPLVRFFADGTQVGSLADLSERPALALSVAFQRCGPRQLETALLLPAGHDGSPLPVLMDPYGGPHAQRVQRSPGLFFTSQWFADQGFAVVVVDGRGTPGRGPAFERAVRGDLAGPVLDDQVEALLALAEQRPELDLSRVAIRGWSFGGYLAALAVLRRPEVFHAAVAGAPVTDWRLYDTHYTERYLGHPDTEPENYRRTDLAAAVGDRRVPPLLLIHGLADDNVVAAHSLQLSRALLEAGHPHTVLPLSGVTHMTPQEEVAENLLLTQLAFLRAALGDEQAAAHRSGPAQSFP